MVSSIYLKNVYRVAWYYSNGLIKDELFQSQAQAMMKARQLIQDNLTKNELLLVEVVWWDSKRVGHVRYKREFVV